MTQPIRHVSAAIISVIVSVTVNHGEHVQDWAARWLMAARRSLSGSLVTHMQTEVRNAQTSNCSKHSQILIWEAANALNTCAFSSTSKLNPLSVDSKSTVTFGAESVSLQVLIISWVSSDHWHVSEMWCTYPSKDSTLVAVCSSPVKFS